jgi:hypothetical protein
MIRTLESELATIQAPQAAAAWLPVAAQHVATARRTLARRTGRAFLSQITLLIVPDHRSYVQIAGPGVEHSLACAFPSAQTMLLSAERLGATSPAEISSTILHEMVHLYFGVATPAPHLPLWLEEGLAQILSESPTVTGGAEVTASALAGSHLPLHRLRTSFPADPALRRLAYGQARAITNFLIREDYGGSAQRLIAQLTGPDGPGLITSLNSDMVATALEYRWLDFERTIGGWAVATLHPSFIMGLGLALLIAAFFVVQHRRARLRAVESAAAQSQRTDARTTLLTTDCDSHFTEDLEILHIVDPHWPVEADQPHDKNPET